MMDHSRLATPTSALLFRARVRIALTLLVALALLPVAVPADGGLAGRLGDRVEERPQVEPIENPFLWRIERDPPSFVYGTMHVSDPRVTTLPASVEEAFQAADAVFTEFEADGISQLSMMPLLQLENAPPLPDRFSREAYLLLRKTMHSRDQPVGAIAWMNFSGIVVSLMTLDQGDLMFEQGYPLDLMLANRAAQEGKEQGELEDFRQIATLFEDLTQDERNRLIIAICGALDDYRESIPEIFEIYMRGDLDELHEAMYSYLPREEGTIGDQLWERMADRRNHVMVNTMTREMSAHPDKVFFFAAGAAHYPGEEGIISLLEGGGYTLTRLAGDDTAIPHKAGHAMADTE